MDGLQMTLPRFFVAEDLGVVLAGPRDATAFLVCRTPRLSCGFGDQGAGRT